MKTQKWTAKIDETTKAFQDAFAHLGLEDLNWKPSPTVWSIAQNIDHLMVINATYFPIIENVRKGVYTLPWIARLGFMVTFFGNVVLDSVQPTRRKKMKTFPIWQPSQSLLPADILIRFGEAQARLKTLITSSSDLIELQTVISSPANKNIVYKLEPAFDIIVTHEQRHLEQAKEVFTHLTLNKK